MKYQFWRSRTGVLTRQMKYRCDKGHEFDLGEATFTNLVVVTTDGQYGFNYCPRCFGEWALKLWPLTEQEDAK